MKSGGRRVALGGRTALASCLVLAGIRRRLAKRAEEEDLEQAAQDSTQSAVRTGPRREIVQPPPADSLVSRVNKSRQARKGGSSSLIQDKRGQDAFRRTNAPALFAFYQTLAWTALHHATPTPFPRLPTRLRPLPVALDALPRPARLRLVRALEWASLRRTGRNLARAVREQAELEELGKGDGGAVGAGGDCVGAFSLSPAQGSPAQRTGQAGAEMELMSACRTYGIMESVRMRLRRHTSIWRGMWSISWRRGGWRM